MKVGLCEGRHEMPVESYIFANIENPLDVKGLERKAKREIEKLDIQAIDLYVSGLTVALIAAINACRDLNISVTLYHFDRDSNSYYPQKVR